MCSVISETHQEIDAKARQDQDHEQQVVLQESGLQERQDAAASRTGEGYGVYATADGGHIAVGAMEPKFYAELCDRLGVDVPHVRTVHACAKLLAARSGTVA